ncbi:MFS transporter [Streptomyces sp. NPDC059650]|uniref:MFS transporter n=1 Tax=Streptomyces sp. NPDC059650 TaxID=3346896 RepID=UPI0036838E76
MMYLSQARATDPSRDAAARTPAATGTRGDTARSRVPATVLALGLVSLVTDASAEMVTAILPMYLMYGLGVGYLQLGALDSLHTGATALFRIGGGFAADRFGHSKAVATCGYALSALTKLVFPAVGSAPAVGALVAADRVGKGIRTAPRDALITAAVPEGELGRAFGVHRAMDTCGALLGPLIAFAVLLAVPGGYDTAFLVSFCLAAAGVVVIVAFVRRGPVPTPRERGLVLRERLASLRNPAIRRCTLAAALLGLLTVGDMSFYVGLQRRLDVPAEALPLLPIGTALVFMTAAVPLGVLADRIGRWPLFLCGHLSALAAYLFLWLAPFTGWPATALVLCLYGLFYAATDGVLMAHISPLIPRAARTTGLAVVQTAQSLARAGGALTFGAVAVFSGLGTAFAVFGCAFVAAIVAARLIHRPGKNS